MSDDEQRTVPPFVGQTAVLLLVAAIGYAGSHLIDNASIVQKLQERISILDQKAGDSDKSTADRIALLEKGVGEIRTEELANSQFRLTSELRLENIEKIVAHTQVLVQRAQ